jgi:hypothetical protein
LFTIYYAIRKLCHILGYLKLFKPHIHHITLFKSICMLNYHWYPRHFNSLGPMLGG